MFSNAFTHHKRLASCFWVDIEQLSVFLADFRVVVRLVNYAFQDSHQSYTE